MRPLALALCPALLLAAPAAAHGPTPSVLGVLDADAEGPRVVQLSVGVAERQGADWRWLCPALWGGPEAPPAVGVPGEPTLVVFGRDGAVALSSGGTRRVPTDAATATSATVLDVTRGATDAYALVRRDARTHVVSIGALGAPIADLGERWTTLQADGDTVIVGAVEGDALRVASVGVSAARLDEASYPLALDDHGVDLRRAYDRMFVVLDAPGDRRLVELTGARSGGEGGDAGRIGDDAVERLAVPTAIHGPVAILGDPGDDDAPGRRFTERLFVVTDGTLVVTDAPDAASDGAFDTSPIDDPRRFTCLSALDETAFVCTRDGLYRLGTDGADQEPVFALAALRPPIADSIAPELRNQCEAEWLDYAGHIGLPPTPLEASTASPEDGPNPGDDDASSRRGRGGCSTVHGPRPLGVLALLLALSGWRAPGRRHGYHRNRRR